MEHKMQPRKKLRSSESASQMNPSSGSEDDNAGMHWCLCCFCFTVVCLTRCSEAVENVEPEPEPEYAPAAQLKFTRVCVIAYCMWNYLFVLFSH